mmetsp:Transcript_15933/g.25846  ORF Transcript_15933/g.25846 Transcript_15933/m.25846 type:complete len:343 (-) Transcript_15933:391-1419(-)
MMMRLTLRNTRKDKCRSSVTSYDSHALVQVDDIYVSHAVTSKGSRKSVLHTSILCHLLGHGGTHEELDSQKLGFLAKTVLWRMKRKQLLPGNNIRTFVVGLDTASGEPNRMSIGRVWIWETVAISCHDALDGANDILVGSIGERCKAGFNGESRNYVIGTKNGFASLYLFSQTLGNKVQHCFAVFSVHNLDGVKVSLETANQVGRREHIEGHAAERVHGIAVVILSETTKEVWLGQCEPHSVDGVCSNSLWSSIEVEFRKVLLERVDSSLKLIGVHIPLGDSKGVKDIVPCFLHLTRRKSTHRKFFMIKFIFHNMHHVGRVFLLRRKNSGHIVTIETSGKRR